MASKIEEIQGKTLDRTKTVIHHFIFPDNEDMDSNYAQIYFRWTRQQPECRHGKVRIPADCSLSTCSFFNIFPAGKWNKYADIHTYTFQILLRGSAKIYLWETGFDEEEGVDRKLLGMKRTISDETRLYEFGFMADALDNNIFIVIDAESDCELYGGQVVARTCYEAKPVNLAIGICTYHREESVRTILQQIYTTFFEQSILADNIGVFVADNGGTLTESDYPDRGVKVMKNKNVGGTGGFVRCLLEALEDPNKEWTHILFLYDDIRLEPESIYRTYMLYSFIRPNFRCSILGGSLMRMDYPYIQHAKGERWMFDHVEFGRNGFNLLCEEDLIVNELEKDVEYNGWWYCAMVLENKKNELPLPFFIHIDDIEYGRRMGWPIMTMNGIGVWHDSFENRKQSAMEYYDMRNSLIMNALYEPRRPVEDTCKRVFRHLVHQMLKYRYDDQLLTLRAVEDFLEGPEYFKTHDPILVHEEIMEMGYHPKNVVKKLYEMKASRDPMRKEDLYRKYTFSLKHKLTLNGWLLFGKKELTALPMGCHATHLYRLKNVLYYDPQSGSGFTVKRKRSMAFVTLFRYAKAAWKLKRKYEDTVQDYVLNNAELCSSDFWKKYLSIG